MRHMKASEFKAKCLKLLDEVAATGEAIVITKRGKPVARVERQRTNSKRSLFGSMAGQLEAIDPNDGLFSTMTEDDIAAMEQNRKRRADILNAPLARRRRR